MHAAAVSSPNPCPPLLRPLPAAGRRRCGAWRSLARRRQRCGRRRRRQAALTRWSTARDLSRPCRSAMQAAPGSRFAALLPAATAAGLAALLAPPRPPPSSSSSIPARPCACIPAQQPVNAGGAGGLRQRWRCGAGGHGAGEHVAAAGGGVHPRDRHSRQLSVLQHGEAAAPAAAAASCACGPTGRSVQQRS